MMIIAHAAYTAGVDTHAVDNTKLGYGTISTSGGVLLGLEYNVDGVSVTSIDVLIQDDFTTPLSRVVVVPNNGAESTCTVVASYGVNGYDAPANRTKLTCALPVPIATLTSVAFSVVKGA